MIENRCAIESSATGNGNSSTLGTAAVKLEHFCGHRKPHDLYLELNE